MKYHIRALPFLRNQRFLPALPFGLRKQCFLPALPFGLRKQCFLPALPFGLRKQCFLFFIAFISIHATAQKGREKIDLARKEIADDLSAFNQKLVDMPLSKNIAELIAKADNPYKQYWVSCVLFDIDKNKSYQMIALAWEQEKDNPWFSLEYALALHRLGRYERAIPAYTVYAKALPEDERVYAWLSECYIQTGNYSAAVEAWSKSGRHTSADMAICTIHKDHDLLEMRMEMLDNISQGMTEYIYELIYMDLNWEADWWNKRPQLVFLEHDLQFIHKYYGDTSQHYQTARAYASIKRLSIEGAQQDEIKTAFLDNKLIIEGNSFPESGQICADLIQIALLYNLTSPEKLLSGRTDLDNLLYEKRDLEFLNIVANLESQVNGKVSKETDLFGWQQGRDICFASSYFIGMGDNLTSDNTELQRALEDFPRSSFLRVLKIHLLEKEGKEIPQELIVEAIKPEYDGLMASASRYCDALNYLYSLLAASLQKK